MNGCIYHEHIDTSITSSSDRAPCHGRPRTPSSRRMLKSTEEILQRNHTTSSTKKKVEKHTRPEFPRASAQQSHLLIIFPFFSLSKTHSSGVPHRTDPASSFSLYSIITGGHRRGQNRRIPPTTPACSSVSSRSFFISFHLSFCLIFLAFLSLFLFFPICWLSCCFGEIIPFIFSCDEINETAGSTGEKARELFPLRLCFLLA